MKVVKVIKLSVVCLFLLSTVLIVNGQENNSQSNVKENPNAPEIYFEKTSHDYGNIKNGSEGSSVFVFKNTGKKPLVLTDVKASCGCTTPTWPREPITQGKSAVIKVVYDTKRIGSFNKTITVTSNAKTSPVVLTIKGVVTE